MPPADWRRCSRSSKTLGPPGRNPIGGATGVPTTGMMPVTNGRWTVSLKKPVAPFITVTEGAWPLNDRVEPCPAVSEKKPPGPAKPKLAPALGSKPPNGGAGGGPPKLKNQPLPRRPQLSPICSKKLSPVAPNGTSMLACCPRADAVPQATNSANASEKRDMVVPTAWCPAALYCFYGR